MDDIVKDAYSLSEEDRLSIIASNSDFSKNRKKTLPHILKKIDRQRKIFLLKNGSFWEDVNTTEVPACIKTEVPHQQIKKKRTYDEHLALLRAREKSSDRPVDFPKEKIAKLPVWPDAVRGVSNAILRGAIFGVSQRRKTHRTRTVIAALDGYEIRFKGETLNQTDLDLWDMLLHIARLQPLGTEVEFTANSLLKELDRGTGKSQHEQLKEELSRLIGGVVEITWTKDKKSFAGALVSSYFRDDETGRYVVKFNPDMAKLYGFGHTLINWAERQALGNNSLAKWLHGFYASHAKPFPYKVETLYELCGSSVERLGDFRKLLRSALDNLVKVGAIKSWSIDQKTDLVEVVNVPSKTQQKHLSKAQKRPKNNPR